MNIKLLTSILDFLPDATFVINRDGKVIVWNRAIEDMAGVRREDMLGKGDYIYAIPFYGERRPTLIDLVLHESKETESSYDYVKKYGTAIYAETYAPALNDGMGAHLWGTAVPLLDDNGNIRGAIESIRDITDRKFTEIKLKDSEEKLRTIFDQTFQFMGLLTPDGTMLAANKTALELVGAAEADVLGKPFWENPWWEHSEEAREMLKDAVKRVASGEFVRFETTHTDTNGTLRYVEFSLRPIKDKDGNTIYLNPEGRDITAIKEAEKDLRQSEEKYRAIFNSVNDAIIIHDLETGAIVDVNNCMCEMYGYTREEALKTHAADISVGAPPYAAEDARNWLHKAATEGPQFLEWRAKDKKGRPFWVEINMRRALIGGHERLLLTVRNIEERKQAEEALRKERQRFLALTEEAPFGIALFDKEGYYTYINAKFREIFGYDLSDIPDRRTWFWKAYPEPEYRHNAIETWLNDVEKFRQDPSLTEGRQRTFTVTCKDNTQKIINFISVQLPTGEYLMTHEDITEQKKAEEELERKGMELDIESKNLEEVNTALKVLLKGRDNDKIELEEKILSNIKELVIPYVEKLKKCRLDSNHMTYVGIIEANLNDIISPFLQKMGLKYARLTPTEIEIASLIKNGKRTKEIGEMLHMSSGAINFHRNNIRKKLGLNKEKVNLRSYLLSI